MVLLKPHPAEPVVFDRGIAPARLKCQPGTSRAVLDELIAANRPQPRPNRAPRRVIRTFTGQRIGVGIPRGFTVRDVPLGTGIDGNIAAIRAIHAAHPDAGNALLDVPGALDTLAQIRMLLEGAK